VNADLPQFDQANPSNGWTEITDAYTLSPFLFSIPVGIQVFGRDGRRSVNTGLLSGTEDRYAPAEEGGDDLMESVFYFQEGPPLTVKWVEVRGVVAMLATPFEKEQGDAE
jgi:hypothetical protein